jgi:colanic acid/amylovoran biosynthesis protein
MKIAITGVTGLRNRGVEALIQPTVDQLLTRYPNAKITISSWSPEYDRKRINSPQVSFVEDVYLKCGLWTPPQPLPSDGRKTFALKVKWRLLGTFGKTTEYQDSSKDYHLSMPFEKPDLVIISGGDLISSDYGTQSLKHFLDPVRWAKHHRVPCVLIGQSIGKFKCAEDLALWRTASRDADLITLREPLSLNYIRDELDDQSSRIVETADCAFLLDANADIACCNPPKTDRFTVAVSMSNSISTYTSSSPSAHLEAWVAVIRMMLEEWDVNVAIIPHVQETYSDDRIPATCVYRQLNFDSRVRVYAEDLTASEYKGIISNCDMVIAERMHAAIAGFSLGICTVPIGYSIKARGITASMLYSTGLDPDELAIPLDKFLDLSLSKKKLTHIWNNRNCFRQSIAKGLDRAKANAVRNFDLIDDLISSRS